MITLHFIYQCVNSYLDSLSKFNLIGNNVNELNEQYGEHLKGPHKLIRQNDYELACWCTKYFDGSSLYAVRFPTNNLIYAKKLMLQLQDRLSQNYLLLYVNGSYMSCSEKWIEPDIPDWWNEMSWDEKRELGYDPKDEYYQFGGCEFTKVRKLVKHDWSLMIAVPYTCIAIKYFKSKKITKMLTTYCSSINKVNDLYRALKLRDSEHIKKHNLLNMKLIKVNRKYINI